MSGFNSTGKDVHVGGDTSLPPKATSNEYIEGMFFLLEHCPRSIENTKLPYSVLH
jgi:hypothetical protein